MRFVASVLVLMLVLCSAKKALAGRSGAILAGESPYCYAHQGYHDPGVWTTQCDAGQPAQQYAPATYAPQVYQQQYCAPEPIFRSSYCAPNWRQQSYCPPRRYYEDRYRRRRYRPTYNSRWW